MYINFQNRNVSSKSGSTEKNNDLRAVLDRYRENLKASSLQKTEEKEKYEERIYQKVNAGKRLTSKEMEYLRTSNPELYLKAVRIQMKRDAVENKLHNCKSKEEVEDIISFELGLVSEKDPDREAIINAVQDVKTEFKKTDKYAMLPEKRKEEEEQSGCEEAKDSECYILYGENQPAFIKKDLRAIDIKI